jgi:hypothetical protein
MVGYTWKIRGLSLKTICMQKLEGSVVPAPHETPVVLLLNDMNII